MSHQFNTALDNFETIEEALRYIPAILLISTKLPDDACREIKSFVDQLITSNKELVQLRYLDDITAKEREVLKSIGNTLEVVEQMAFEDHVDLGIAPEVLQGIKDKANKLIRHIKKEVNLDQPVLTDTYPAQSKTIQQTETTSSEAFEEFITERTAGGNWELKTRQSYQNSFSLFSELIGDVPISSIKADQCRSFKSKIQKLPKNHTKIAKYRDKGAAKLTALKLPQDQLISTESVNKHIGRISSFLHWCKRQGYLDTNYMEGMTIRISKNQIEKRQPFSIDDLNNLFDDPIFTQSRCKHSYYFWLPLIALYTGARIQEICQLEIKDIYTVEDLLVIDINDNSSTKRLKNTNSARLIPVHQHLVDIGFERLISRRKRHKSKYLFPELHTSSTYRDGVSQPASKWFARYKVKHGFKVDGVKAFHSFRHTFINELKNKNVPEHVTAALAGHGHQNITYAVYGSTSRIEMLNEHLQKIGYKGLHLDSIYWKPK